MIIFLENPWFFVAASEYFFFDHPFFDGRHGFLLVVLGHIDGGLQAGVASGLPYKLLDIFRAGVLKDCSTELNELILC